LKNNGYKRGGARPGAGRVPFEPTEADRSLVKALASVGFQHSQIAGIVRPGGIGESTLRKYFSYELAVGKDHIDAICVTGIVKAMQAGNLAAMFFWAKTRMGWREKDSDDGDTRAVDKLDEIIRVARYGPARSRPPQESIN
jgi:hypothetical protein